MNESSESHPERSSTPDAIGEPFSRRDVVAIALTCIVWTLLALAIDPRGDFPLIDDWAYALPVRAFLERGEFRLTDFSNPTLVVQGIWGALFCLPTGFSFTTLRISTLVAGLIGLIGMYALMRQLGARQTVALFAAWVVGVNPIYICESYTFMTDIPFTCLVILSTFFLVRGMVRDSDRAIWLGLGLALASVFVRQIGVAIFLGFAAAYPFWRGLGRRWFLQAVLPAVLAFVALKAYERGLIAFERLPRIYSKFGDATADFLSRLAKGRIGVFKVMLAKLWGLLLLLGRYILPFSLLCWPTRLARLSRRGRIAELGWVVGLTVVATIVLVATGGVRVTVGSIIYDFGAGPRFFNPEYWPEHWPGRMPSALNLGVKFMSVLGVILALQALGLVIWRILIRPQNPAGVAWRSCAIFLIVTCALHNGPTSMSLAKGYDRYMLAILPLAVALVWKGISMNRPDEPNPPFPLRPVGVAAGLVSLLLYLAFSAAATHDYLDWSRVRWQTDLSLAQELAIPATDIDGGWEYNNCIANIERLYKSYQERESMMDPLEKQGEVWGQSLERPYRVSGHLSSGYEFFRKVPLSPWLPLAPRQFIISKKIDPPSPAR